MQNPIKINGFGRIFIKINWFLTKNSDFIKNQDFATKKISRRKKRQNIFSTYFYSTWRKQVFSAICCENSIWGRRYTDCNIIKSWYISTNHSFWSWYHYPASDLNSHVVTLFEWPKKLSYGKFFFWIRKLNRAGSFCAILARKLEPVGIFFANFDDFGQVHSGYQSRRNSQPDVQPILVLLRKKNLPLGYQATRSNNPMTTR